MAVRKNNPMIESQVQRQEVRMDVSEHFGALKDNPLLDKLEADSTMAREAARPIADGREYQALIN